MKIGISQISTYLVGVSLSKIFETSQCVFLGSFVKKNLSNFRAHCFDGIFFQGQSICTEGQSLFQDEEEEENDSSESFAFTQYPRPTLYPSLDSDQPHDAKFMGYSIVTEKFRLTNWFRFNSKVSVCIYIVNHIS